MRYHITSHADEQPTHLKSYPCNCCITSGAILRIQKRKRPELHPFFLLLAVHQAQKWEMEGYQQGVPTNVFLERCLSPVSNMQAETPKSANLTVPLESSKIFPACQKTSLMSLHRKGVSHLTTLGRVMPWYTEEELQCIEWTKYNKWAKLFNIH